MGTEIFKIEEEMTEKLKPEVAKLSIWCLYMKELSFFITYDLWCSIPREKIFLDDSR